MCTCNGYTYSGYTHYEQALIRERKKRKCTFRKAQLLYAYGKLVGEGTLAPCAQLASLLVKKSSKSQSGVLVITVLTSPYPYP